MSYHKNDTQKFLDYSYERVLDRLAPVFLGISPGLALDSESEKVLEDLALEPGSELPELSEEDEIEINRWCLRPIVRTYVTGMIRAMVDNSAQNYEFSEEELNKLWASKSEELAKKYGLTSEDGEITLKAVKETFLEDLFDEPVTVSARKKLYTISRTENGLYIVPQS